MGRKCCKFCGGKLIKDCWTQALEGGMCPVGTYFYYYCGMCGFRYSVKEVKSEKAKVI